MGRSDPTRDFQSDDQQAVLPDQFFAGTQDPAVVEGERRLILAVLADAIQAFKKYAAASDPRGQALFREVEEWFMDPEPGAVLSFEYVGEALGLDLAIFRARLRHWHAEHLARHHAAIEPLAIDARSASLKKASGE